MQFHKQTIIANIILLAIFGILLGLFGLPGVGAAAVIVGGIDLFLVLVYLIAKNKPAIKTALLFSGILLLIGFSLCSAFQFNVH
jgi:Na+-driven multidrug efflux pump